MAPQCKGYVIRREAKDRAMLNCDLLCSLVSMEDYLHRIVLCIFDDYNIAEIVNIKYNTYYYVYGIISRAQYFVPMYA